MSLPFFRNEFFFLFLIIASYLKAVISQTKFTIKLRLQYLSVIILNSTNDIIFKIDLNERGWYSGILCKLTDNYNIAHKKIQLKTKFLCRAYLVTK